MLGIEYSGIFKGLSGDMSARGPFRESDAGGTPTHMSAV